jgi:peptide/nickel transport system substrate-binding protein
MPGMQAQPARVTNNIRRRAFLGSLAPLAAHALALPGCKRKPPPVPAHERRLVVVQEQQASWVRNFNPLLPPGSVRWPTPAGIYEPLFIFNTMRGEYVPWLATEYRFADGNATLGFRIRAGVHWSDGTPFTPNDVVFTFELMQRFPALDSRGVWSQLAKVERGSDDEVLFRFRRVFVPGMFRIAQQPIVPQHVWQKIHDPVSFQNPNPVATGPFTEVATFQNQVYELDRNPHYWQPGLPRIRGLSFPAFAGNEQANLALLHGEVDWSGRFVPDVERVFVGRDPEHHRYWFPNQGGAHSLYPNHARPPLDDVRVRKALSHALDRRKIIEIAVYDYTRPANAAGLSEAYRDWFDLAAISDPHWVEHDLARANALLDEAGLSRSSDGFRKNRDGSPLEFAVNVVTGWSDWVTVVQLIKRDLERVGIRVRMHALSYAAFYEALLFGNFDLSMGWAEEGPTPYHFYQFVMGPAGRKPIGERGVSNWGRFHEDDVDRTLAEFELTSDPGEQRRLSSRLQGLFAEHAPIVPLYPSPSWGVCNTGRFVGFPSKENPYARLSPFSPPEYLLVLLSLEPR